MWPCVGCGLAVHSTCCQFLVFLDCHFSSRPLLARNFICLFSPSFVSLFGCPEYLQTRCTLVLSLFLPLSLFIPPLFLPSSFLSSSLSLPLSLSHAHTHSSLVTMSSPPFRKMCEMQGYQEDFIIPPHKNCSNSHMVNIQ